MSKFMEVVGESLKGMNVILYQGFREGGETNEKGGREWRRNLGVWPLKSSAELLKM